MEHPRELPPCDLVMKGGVTSGVVYPGALLELSTRYRFEKVGGTSAGAVAAALAAAAEFARQRSGEPRLQGLTAVVEDIQQPGFFLRLFQPSPAARPLFGLLLVLSQAARSRRRQTVALVRVAVRFRPAPAAAAVIGVGLVLVLLAAGFRHLPIALNVLLLVLGAVAVTLLAAWAVLAPLVAMGRGALRSLPAEGFGLCRGVASGPGAPEALTEWLHRRIQGCAGLPLDAPLTFADLGTQGISLQMVATDLGLERPVTIPAAPEQYLFAPCELARLFPAPVVDHVLRVAGVPAGERDSARTWFLPADELPVVIGVRLSASVPVLLSSLRLYSAHPGASGPVESLMADGGITSNFPIHFFDDWLPSHPTFGLDLMAGGQHDVAAVTLPGDDDAPRAPRAETVRSLGAFLGQVQDAARSWRDELQAELPGFRDRVCQIRIAPGEGGFHLDADPASVERLLERGHEAGREILGKFDWEHHRMTRYLTLIALLQENFKLLGQRFAGWRGAGTDPASEQALRELIAAAERLPSPAGDPATVPEPAMRVGPRI